MTKNSIFNIKRIFSAASYSMAGLRFAFRTQPAFRQDLILCAVAAISLIFIPVGANARAVMFASLFMIPIAELVNTGIECAIDRMGTKYHPMAKAAKDIGSAVVMITIIAVAVLWTGLILAAM